MNNRKISDTVQNKLINVSKQQVSVMRQKISAFEVGKNDTDELKQMLLKTGVNSAVTYSLFKMIAGETLTGPVISKTMKTIGSMVGGGMSMAFPVMSAVTTLITYGSEKALYQFIKHRYPNAKDKWSVFKKELLNELDQLDEKLDVIKALNKPEYRRDGFSTLLRIQDQVIKLRNEHIVQSASLNGFATNGIFNYLQEHLAKTRFTKRDKEEIARYMKQQQTNFHHNVYRVYRDGVDFPENHQEELAIIYSKLAVDEYLQGRNALELSPREYVEFRIHLAQSTVKLIEKVKRYSDFNEAAYKYYCKQAALKADVAMNEPQEDSDLAFA